MNILITEDDRKIAKSLKLLLESEGYKVTLCKSCQETYEKSAEKYDLMIIDITLPDGDGFELFEQLRNITDTPCIFLTARDDEDSIVNGFRLGGDDYITKPFSARELLARVGRFKRKSQSDSLLKVGDISLDYKTHIVTQNGQPVELTALEYKLLLMLMQNCGSIVSRESILEKIWDMAYEYKKGINSIEQAVLFGSEARRSHVEDDISSCQYAIGSFYREYERALSDMKNDRYYDKLNDMKVRMDTAVRIYLGLDEEKLKEYLESSEIRQKAYLEEVLADE